MIQVTKPFLPPINEYLAQIERIWASHQVSNRGPLVLELEFLLKDFLKAKNILLMTNGTIPLQIAVKLLGNRGEVITTPFSYVATTSAIVWENCTPVFVDIHPKYLTIDESKIESVITSRTTAILATHVFGNACETTVINNIAKKYGLKVIYDAAHCFGVKYLGKDIFSFGDVSTCSFHATKIFHTGQGGAIFCSENQLFDNMFISHRFGIGKNQSIHGLGINGIMSELHAAMGLALFPYINQIISQRKSIAEIYDNLLDANLISKLQLRSGVEWNYCYYPILFESEGVLLKVTSELEKLGIFPRRYFYPTLNSLPYLEYGRMNIAEDVAARIVCLPLYPDLNQNIVHKICQTINGVLHKKPR